MSSCECYQIGGRFIAEDPDCPEHGIDAQDREAENENLREDVERLNWLENNSELVLCVGSRWYSRSAYGHPHKRAMSLREAIDSARGKNE